MPGSLEQLRPRKGFRAPVTPGSDDDDPPERPAQLVHPREGIPPPIRDRECLAGQIRPNLHDPDHLSVSLQVMDEYEM